jgi:hypothetical protein
MSLVVMILDSRSVSYRKKLLLIYEEYTMMAVLLSSMEVISFISSNFSLS